MTIGELIEELRRHPPETRVFEEREGELRELHIADVCWHPTGTGHPIEEDEEDGEDCEIAVCNSWADEEPEGAADGPIIVFGS